MIEAVETQEVAAANAMVLVALETLAIQAAVVTSRAVPIEVAANLGEKNVKIAIPSIDASDASVEAIAVEAANITGTWMTS